MGATLSLWLGAWFAPREFGRARETSTRVRARGSDAGVPLGENDEALVARIRSGDSVAFTEMYEVHLELLVQFAYGYVRSEAVAQDIVADIFVHLWEARTMWAPTHSIRAYLLTAVRHRAFNALRNNARAEEMLERSAAAGDAITVGELISADETLELEERRRLIRQAIERLSPDRRRAMLLRWRFGMTPVEIADAMGISRAAVDQLISRGIKTLRQFIRD